MSGCKNPPQPLRLTACPWPRSLVLVLAVVLVLVLVQVLALALVLVLLEHWDKVELVSSLGLRKRVGLGKFQLSFKEETDPEL